MSTTLALKGKTKYETGHIQLTSTSELKTSDSYSSITAIDNVNISISPEHLRKVFDKFDYSQTGTLDLCEFSSACYCIIGKKKLCALDINQIFNTIDTDTNNVITFDEFCEFIEPSKNITNNSNITKYPSPKPPASKFNDDYISSFWARDLGTSLISGNNGMNAYVKWRFTEHARKHISYGSKIIEINSKNMDGLLFDEIIDFLNIVIIATEGFKVKFRPSKKLQQDRYFPTDFRTFKDDNIKDCELLKPQFDKKRKRRHSLRKLLTSHKNIQVDASMLSSDGCSITTTSMHSEIAPSSQGNNHLNGEYMKPNINIYEVFENCKTPNCWFKFPKIVLTLFCIPKINSISQFKKYGSHCRHCPKKAKQCRLMLHNILDNEKYSKLSYAIQIFIMSMILISTLSYVIETLPILNNNPKAKEIFNWIESSVSIIFTLEYLLRIIASRNLCVFFWDGLNLIDFVAIIPFWIELVSGTESSNALRVIRVIRLARVFRLMKSPRFAEYMDILQRTLTASMGSFGLFLTLIFLEIIVASSLVYVCEQTVENTKFTSIPATSWWAFVTVTTIGYGDMVPQSILGRIICVFTLFSGLLVIALPVIIIGGNFSEEYGKYVQRKAGWTASNYGKEYEVKKQQIFTVARLLHFINDQQCKDIFEWQDVKYLCDEGLDSFEIINRILTFHHGHCYLPKEFSSYKKYALFEFYGQKLRRHNQQLLQAENNKSEKLYERKRKSQTVPSTNKWSDIAGLIQHGIHTPNEEKFEETDTLLSTHKSESTLLRLQKENII